VERFKEEAERLLKGVYDGKPDSGMLAAAGKAIADRVKSEYTGVTADFDTPDAAMLMRLTSDVWHFSAAKNYQQLRDLTTALKDGEGKLRGWGDYREAAAKVCEKYNRVWMQTEYRFAIAASQTAARWTEFEKEADVIPNLQYQTVGDSSVRADHARLDGVVRPVGDNFWQTHYPPNGWNCRCEAIQAPGGPEMVTQSVPDVPVPAMFRTNLAQTGVIFPKEHPYYSGVPRAELRKAIAWLPPENTYQSVVIGDYEIDIHPLHGKGEVSRNVETSYMLLKHEPTAKLKLLPIIEEKDFAVKDKFYPKDYIEKFKLKNGDTLYNGRVAEYEEPSGKGRSISNSIRGGKEQSDFVILRLPDGLDWDGENGIERAIYGQLSHYKGQNFELWAMDNNQLRKYKTR
jgi:SPP1 gp7 family putative phage head morphogenesis protein